MLILEYQLQVLHLTTTKIITLSYSQKTLSYMLKGFFVVLKNKDFWFFVFDIYNIVLYK